MHLMGLNKPRNKETPWRGVLASIGTNLDDDIFFMFPHKVASKMDKSCNIVSICMREKEEHN